jgi:hypothetical protein
VPRRIDQVKLVDLTISGTIFHAHRLQFDRDTLFSLEIERVKELLTLFTLANRACYFEQSITQRRFTVINMGNDAEITDVQLI